MSHCHNSSVEELRDSHRLVAEFDYTPREPDRGYTNEVLCVDLSRGEVEFKAVPDDVRETFTGGRGYGLYYLWQSVNSETEWNDPENEIVISSGPIGGITQYPGAGKSYVVTISPLTGVPIDSNVGGYFGPYLKFSGFDALELKGKAEEDTIVLIDWDNKKIRLEEAPKETLANHILSQQLTEMYADSEEDRRHVSVVTSGEGAENTRLGLLNFSYYDVRRQHVKLKQAGRGGIGTVFRDKKIKALVVKYSGLKGDSNNPADFGKIAKTGIKLHREISEFDAEQNNMRATGTSYLTGIMNDYDLLPTNNFKYGSHPDGDQITADVWANYLTTDSEADGCWYGCTLACARAVDGFKLKTGHFKGQEVIIDGPEYETIAGVGSNCGIFDPEAILEVNFYCDTYGIDTISFGTLCAFVMECFEAGVIDEEITGGLKLNFGNHEAQLELLHQMGKGEGFGKIAGQGIRRMKKIFAEEYGAPEDFLQDIGMEAKGLEYSEYVSKESLAQQGGYGIANKGPQHDEAWLIFMDMVNNQLPTFEDKAEALHYFPMFRTWFSLVGLCKLPWNDIVPEGNEETEEPNKIPEHLQNYTDLFTAVTGKEATEQDLVAQSERVYNFQRVFNLRLGYGTRSHDDIPYRSVGPVTVEEYESRQERYDKQLQEKVGFDPEGKSTEEKLQALRDYREDRYDRLRDAVYKRRGWTAEGIPTLGTLSKLGIDYPSVVEVVKNHLE